jgi:predicted RNA binding protein YcfA (HicA-like mRNA interferase family)
MGRLAGFRYSDLVRKLRKAGFEFERHAAGSHEIWRHSGTLRKTTLVRHPSDIPEGTLRAIIHEAGLTPDEFLKL